MRAPMWRRGPASEPPREHSSPRACERRRRARRSSGAHRVSVQTIRQAAQGGVWQAAAWRLERRHPDQWGRRQQDVVVSGQAVVQIIDDVWESIPLWLQGCRRRGRKYSPSYRSATHPLSGPDACCDDRETIRIPSRSTRDVVESRMPNGRTPGLGILVSAVPSHHECRGCLVVLCGPRRHC